MKHMFRFFKKEKSYVESLIEKGMKIGRTSIPTFHTHSVDGIYPWLIEIGEHVIVSTDVCIVAHDASTTPFIGYAKLGAVTIGDNVYIGQNVTILCGVTIGNNVVIGAKSLVNRNLESNFVYAGVPAKKLCSIEEFISKNIKLKESLPTFENNFLYWQTASKKEKQKMMGEVKQNGGGFIKSRIIK